jgi:RNase E specificity factor CsrD
VRWLRRQLSGQELLEMRSVRILNGERGPQVRGSVYEWPSRTSSALDMLLSEIQFASDQRSRMDTLIRSYAAQDNKTGLNNRLFFDNQLATLLEDQEKVGTHGVVMMIRLPDFDLLRDNWGQRGGRKSLYADQPALHLYYALPGALLALSPQRFCRAAAPHAERGGKHRQPAAEGGGCAAAEQNARRDDMVHMGICAWRSGQSTEQVMEHAEAATRNAVLQGATAGRFMMTRCRKKGAATCAGVR